jgi:hypothetical protein
LLIGAAERLNSATAVNNEPSPIAPDTLNPGQRAVGSSDLFGLARLAEGQARINAIGQLLISGHAILRDVWERDSNGKASVSHECVKAVIGPDGVLSMFIPSGKLVPLDLPPAAIALYEEMDASGAFESIADHLSEPEAPILLEYQEIDEMVRLGFHKREVFRWNSQNGIAHIPQYFRPTRLECSPAM